MVKRSTTQSKTELQVREATKLSKINGRLTEAEEADEGTQ